MTSTILNNRGMYFFSYFLKLLIISTLYFIVDYARKQAVRSAFQAGRLPPVKKKQSVPPQMRKRSVLADNDAMPVYTFALNILLSGIYTITNK